MNHTTGQDALAALAQRRGRTPTRRSRKAVTAIAVLKAKKLSDDETMATPRVYGPYKARNGYRMVVVEGTARKSMVVPTIEAGEKLRIDLEQVLVECSDRPIPDVLIEYQDYLRRVRGAITASNIARAIERFLGDKSLGSISPARAAALYDAETRRLLDGKGRPVAAASHHTLLGQCKRFYACVTTQRRSGRSEGKRSKLRDGLLARQEGLPYWLDSPRLQAVEAVQGRVATSEARFSPG